MHALTIDRATVRYRLPASTLELHGKLERVRERVFEAGLEAALEAEGLIGHEQLCIRSLAISLRIPASFGETELLDLWVRAAAREFGQRIRDADPREVVRYGSPVAAILDMARSLARGDRRRAWAWASLGLCRPEELESPSGSARVLVRALLARPEQIVTVLAGLGASAGRVGRALADMVSERAWIELCDAAALVHGVDAATRGRMRAALVGELEPSPASVERSSVREPSEWRRMLAAAPRRSTIVALLAGSPSADVSVVGRRAVVLLALLDASPSAARRLLAAWPDPLTAAEVFEQLADHLGAASQRVSETRGPTAKPRDREASERARAIAAGGETHAPPASHERMDARDGAPTDDDRTRLARSARQASTSSLGEESSTLRPSSPSRSTLEPWRDEPLDARVRGETEWAGLLFVLAMLRHEQLWPDLDALAGAHDLDLRALLHGFVDALLPKTIAPADPARLAFAGLPPEAEPPPPLPPALDEPLAELALRLIAALERRLPIRDHRPARGPALLDWLVRRPGEVLAEPGWLELRMPLRFVDTDIRRAGLDLDPDWLPELGVVVKFVYV